MDKQEQGVWSLSTLGIVVAGLSLLAGCRAPLGQGDACVEPTTPSADHRAVLVDFESAAERDEAVAVSLPDGGPTLEPVQPGVIRLSSTPTPPARQPVEQLVAVAIVQHPRVRAARARYASATWRPEQARSLDDPMLSNTFFPISDQALQTAGGRAGNTMSLSQKYPWPAKREVKGAIAEREAQIAATKIRQAELEIEELVRLAYYELWFADRAIGITERNREIAIELVKLAEARNAAGGSQQDVLRASLQVDNLDSKLISLTEQKALAQADLAALTQQPSAQGIEPIETIDLTGVEQQREALFALALEYNPSLNEQRWAISRDRQKQELACLQKRPDFTFGVGWQTITESDAISPVANGHDNISFAVGLTLPIWRDRIRAGINEASAAFAAASREYADTRDDTFRRIRRYNEQAQAAQQQLDLYENRLMPRSKRALELASADYRGRLVDFGEVTAGFTELLMIELQVARTKATLAGAIAQLERAVGCGVDTTE
ncbi:TolC family protein [Pseudobythopirellula maris]|nr:TolC family protein [Pseudobythopirellula maris]